jgi:hypothetical protein
MTPLTLLLISAGATVVFIYTLFTLICLTSARINDERTGEPLSWFHRVMGVFAYAALVVAFVGIAGGFLWWAATLS